MDLVNISLKPQGKWVCRMNSWAGWKFRGFSLFSASRIFAENMQKPEGREENDTAAMNWRVWGQSSTFPKQLHSTLGPSHPELSRISGNSWDPNCPTQPQSAKLAHKQPQAEMDGPAAQLHLKNSQQETTSWANDQVQRSGSSLSKLKLN